MLASILPESILPLDPLSKFVIVGIVILLLPLFSSRLRLPGVVGLILGGVLLGSRGLGVIGEQSGLKHAADVGKLMVMFFAGMEIHLDQFARTAKRSLSYGLSTFIIPLLTGVVVARVFGMSWNAAILTGSLLASHTLLALPILIRHKVVRREAVTVTIGATMFTDVAALIVLATCVAIHTVGFSPVVLAVRLVGLAIYAPVIMFGARWMGRRYIKPGGDFEDEGALGLLLLVGLAALGAELIHLEGIVGAFVVGLAVGDVAREGPIRQRLDTLGNTLFVPAFFLIVGALIDPLSFLRMSPSALGFMGVLIAGLIGAKYLAALVVGKMFGYCHTESKCMWSLSMPQVAATLAAALVAYEAVNKAGDRLISESVLDAVLVLVMVTSILGPILTQRFVKQLPADEEEVAGEPVTGDR